MNKVWEWLSFTHHPSTRIADRFDAKVAAVVKLPPPALELMPVLTGVAQVVETRRALPREARLQE